MHLPRWVLGVVALIALAWPVQIHGAWGCTQYYEGAVPAVMALAASIVGAPPPVSYSGLLTVGAGCADDGWIGARWIELAMALTLTGAVAFLVCRSAGSATVGPRRSNI